MAPATATLAPSAAVEPTARPTAALTLANVLYEKKDAIAYVTVNRPKVLNALNTPTWKDLRTAFEDARNDARVRGVILTGAGDKAFIAGADTGELAHVAAFEAEQSSRFGQGVLDLIENARRRLRDGDGVHHQDRGGRREIRPARSHARTRSRRRRHAAPASPGRQGPGPATHPLRRNDQHAGGVPHRARQRNRAGGKSHRARRGDPEADHGHAPVAVRLSLEAVNKGMDTSQRASLEASYFGLCAATDDKKEGTSAFLEKRAPQFHGC
jgi:enoyl-CoA hydratase/carnithine racemase